MYSLTIALFFSFWFPLEGAEVRKVAPSTADLAYLCTMAFAGGQGSYFSYSNSLDDLY